MSSLSKIKNKLFAIILLFLQINFFISPAFGFYSQFIVPTHEHEENFLQNIDGTTDILGALIASDVEPQNYSFYTSEIQRWKKEIEDTLPRGASQHQLAQNIGYYLHDKVYSKYRLSATTLKEVFETGHFNCLSATILMNIILRSFGVTAQSIILPTHVYTLATLDGKKVEIENTIREGLAISQDKEVQTRFNKLTGFDYSNSKNKKVVIEWKETVGLLYSNRSYFEAKRNRHNDAFQSMMKAQVFLAKTPSEQKNLIAGYLNYSYYTYKKKQAPIQEYLKTLSVLEEGIERFPKYDNLKGNYLKGVDIVLEQMVQSQADKNDINYLVAGSQKYLNPSDFQKLQKSHYIRLALYHIRTNKNYKEAQGYIKNLWEQNPRDKDTHSLIQEFSYAVVLDDVKDPKRREENPEVLALLEEFPKKLTAESLGCYYSSLAKNNFNANLFSDSVNIMVKGQKLLGNIRLITQNGFVYSVNSAQYFIDKQEFLQAIKFYKQALLFKKDRNVINNLGVLYEKVISQYLAQNKTKQAQTLIQESREITPNHPALNKIHKKYS